jgi:hypothetical protein
MQLKVKLNEQGEVDKRKARLCGCGNEIAEDTEVDTYSPTISALAYSLVHQISIIDNMHACTIDTTSAYLYQDYPQDITPLYLVLPKEVALLLGLDPATTYRVMKYLYGLPDAGRAYYNAYSAHLIAHGYFKSDSDPCLFIKLSDTSRTYLWTHVDDTYCVSTDPAELLLIQSVLQKKFQITVKNKVSGYLGVSMKELPDGSIQLLQPKLLQSIFEDCEAYLFSYKSGTYPNPQSRRSFEGHQDSLPVATKKYGHILGALLYLLKSRPDIATFLSFAGTKSCNPTMGDYKLLMQCVNYLYNTQDVGLILHRGNALPNSPLTLTCYVDASYLTHEDARSHTGYCLSLGSFGTFYSRSVKQTLVATSSTHAEMRALYTLTTEIVFVENLCRELGRPLRLPAIVFEDNAPVLQLTAPVSAKIKKSKHFLMIIAYIKEKVNEGLLSICKIPTAENTADVLTKITSGSEFLDKASALLGTSSLRQVS